MLHLVEEAVDALVIFLSGDADAFQLGEHVRFAGLIGNQKLAAVANRLRRDMLVGRRLLHDGRRVDAGLGRKRAFPDIGGVAVRRPIEHLIEGVGDMPELLELQLRDADVETLGKLRLELERRDDRDEIGVATALAQSVEGSLDLARPRAHGRKRVCHRLLGIVMGVDADMIARDDLDHLCDDLLHFMRQSTAVGVAEHDPSGAFLISRPGTGERELRVCLVAVEEMLAVEHHLSAVAFGRAHAVTDGGEVLLWAGFERDTDMIIP